MWTRTPFALLVALALSGCGDDAKTDVDSGVPTDAGADMGSACQPASTHEEIIMAPTSADVVRKTPTHPPVGDGGLP